MTSSRSYSRSLSIVPLEALVAIAFWGALAYSQDSVNDGLGIKIHSGVQNQSPTDSYTKSWAVIIGINYSNTNVPDAARSLVPELKNAEKDARDMRDVLTKLYGYKSDHVLYKPGAEWTKEAIERALNNLKEDGRITANDSVLVFFSGHGARIENEEGERGALYATNVEFSERGKLLAGYLRMHKDLLPVLDKCPAKHKLLILDCCHSGEIFSLHAQSRSVADDRMAPALFEERGSVQAIASCLDRQRASDGIGKNSPFTSALLTGLRRIPAREGLLRSRLGVNRLFTFMLPELKTLPNGQSPDCRLLGSVNGEFSFFPSSSKEAQDEFNEHGTKIEEFRTLQAMVPGDHGNWWFEEMPWFVPSLRLAMLEGADMPKSGLQATAIRTEELRELADNLDQSLQKLLGEEKNVARRALLDLRRRHMRSLRTNSPKELPEVVAEIVSDLTSLESPIKKELEATDLHLIAVCKHYLDQRRALKTSYKDVEEAYQEALKRFVVENAKQLTLKSLCHADYGYYLSIVKRDYGKAALQFKAALSLFGSDLAPNVSRRTPSDDSTEKTDQPTHHIKPIIAGSAPPAFRTFVLCSEAEAWQRQNRWGQANDLLNTALCVAEGIDTEHELTVFVLNKIAWAEMEQWRIEEALKYFVRANQILLKLAESTADHSLDGKVAAHLNREPPVDKADRDFEIMLECDSNSLTRYLHHLHGLAMAKRFQGQEKEAIVDFRKIIQRVAKSLDRLKHGNRAAVAGSDAESKLLDRLINSQERLADCNLFGDPMSRDLQEAGDDYRRALNASMSLPVGDDRTKRRISLLYKLALTLALPTSADRTSSRQDMHLAQEYCRDASALRKSLNVRSEEVYGTIGELTEAIMPVFSKASDDAGGNEFIQKGEALSKLRDTIHDFRDKLGGNPNRDQLEMLLLAAKVLVDNVPPEDRYHLAEDSELLLHMCRLVLPNVAPGLDERVQAQETRTYLRPYYDTVMLNKLRMKPKHVKGLLEIQWEATKGEFYTKAPETDPVLALYLLGDECYLLLDVPNGPSMYTSLKGNYYVSSVKRACYQEEFRLPLPDEIKKELLRIGKSTSAKSAVKLALPDPDDPAQPLADESGSPQQTTDASARWASRLDLRWLDPVRELGAERSGVGPTSTSETSKTATVKTMKFVKSRFPFLLPDEIEAQ